MAESIRNSATASRAAGILLSILLAGCAAEEYPNCCGATGIRDVPYAKTYRFNFHTGSFDIVAPNSDRILGILTQADVLTLMNAASVTQASNKGLISGVLRGPRGPLREASLVVRDADGNLVTVTDGPLRNFFYNSLGRVPDFLISAGSTDQGSFTMFNAPPGELFLQLVGGGRGNGRIMAYPSSVSIGRYNVLEVFPPRIGALGVAVDAFTTATVGGVTVAMFGWTNGSGGNSIGTGADGLFLIPRDQGLPTQANLMLSLSSPNYRTTYYRFDTPISRVIARQQAFDPVTLDNLLVYPEAGVQAWAVKAGVNIPSTAGIILGRVVVPSGTGVSGAAVTAMNREGQHLTDQGIRVYYSGNAAEVGDQLDPTLTSTRSNGRYVLFIPDCDALPGRTAYLSAIAQTIILPPVMQTGRAAASCMPGGVFVQDIVVQDYPKSVSNFYTTPFQGRVMTLSAPDDADDEDLSIPVPVADARVDMLGVGTGPYITDEAGLFTIPRATSPDAIEPLLVFSPYTARISVRTTGDPNGPADPAYLPTYVNVLTGLTGRQLDLTVVPSSLKTVACGGDSLNILGLLRDLGAVDASRQGLPVEGMSVAVFNADGTPASGRVVYQGSPTGLKTGLSGLFAVCNLPVPQTESLPAFYQVRVVSEDDSGATQVEVFSDGVAFLDMVVNKALPRNIPSTGRLTKLFGPSGASAALVESAVVSVLGLTEQVTKKNPDTDLPQRDPETGEPVVVDRPVKRFIGSSSGFVDDGGPGAERFTMEDEGILPLPSYGEYILRAEKDGYLPTLNYQIATPGRLRQDSDVLTLPDLFITSLADLERVGIQLTTGTGIAAGTTITPGLAPRDEQASVPGLVGIPVRLIAGFIDRSNLFPDILAVFSDGTRFLYGDGFGNLAGPDSQPVRDGDGTALILSVVRPADFNLDGNVDLAAIANQKVYAIYGRRDGTFEAAQELSLQSSGTVPFALEVADLDADGDQDVAVATNGANPIVRFMNKTGGSFAINSGDPVGDTCGSSTPAVMGVELVPGAGPNGMMIADQDGSLCLYPFNNNGNPLAMTALSIPTPAVWMETAFLDLDAISDMVIVHQTGVSVFLSVANQSTPPAPIEVDFPEGVSPRSALLGDLNRDFRDDLLVSGDSGVLFYAGAGNGRFNTPTTLSGSTATGEMTAADLNGDGRADLVAHQDDGNLAQFRGADLPAAGVQIETRDEAGRSTGQVYYLDDQGDVDPAATATGTSGRFLVAAVPPGFTMVRVANGGSGNALVSAYPDTVSYTEVDVNPVQETVSVIGQTIDPIVTETSGTVAEGIRITPLGTDVDVRSSDGRGPADPSTGAFQLTLDANSEYVIKLQP